MGNENVFETPDLYLSSAIVMILNVEPLYTVRNEKTFFGFPVSDELYKSMAAYNAGATLCASQYADTIKRLRAEMYARRRAGHPHAK